MYMPTFYLGGNFINIFRVQKSNTSNPAIGKVQKYRLCFQILTFNVHFSPFPCLGEGLPPMPVHEYCLIALYFRISNVTIVGWQGFPTCGFWTTSAYFCRLYQRFPSFPGVHHLHGFAVSLGRSGRSVLPGVSDPAGVSCPVGVQLPQHLGSLLCSLWMA